MGTNSSDSCSLAQGKCTPCQGGVEPLKGEAIGKYASELAQDWQVIEEHHLEKTFTFKNFRQALDLTNKIGELAEDQGHHPEILLGWGKVKVTVWTHKIGGLHENDFILAAKIDQL